MDKAKRYRRLKNTQNRKIPSLWITLKVFTFFPTCQLLFTFQYLREVSFWNLPRVFMVISGRNRLWWAYTVVASTKSQVTVFHAFSQICSFVKYFSASTLCWALCWCHIYNWELDTVWTTLQKKTRVTEQAHRDECHPGEATKLQHFLHREPKEGLLEEAMFKLRTEGTAWVWAEMGKSFPSKEQHTCRPWGRQEVVYSRNWKEVGVGIELGGCGRRWGWGQEGKSCGSLQALLRDF